MDKKYIEDVPNEDPKFDFRLISKALSPLLLRPNKNAFVLGIHGSWGSGKTTLMRALRYELETSPSKDRLIFIEFNAWKFQDRQALWRALILHILAELRNIEGEKAEINELERALYQAFAVEEKGPWTINWRTLIVEFIGILLSLLKLDFVSNAIKDFVSNVIKDSTGWFGRIFIGSKDKNEKKEEPMIEKERVDKLISIMEQKTIERNVIQIQSIEQFLDKFRNLIGQLTQGEQRVFVFIDDLDRCLPESALEIFESIKLFLDAPGCGYVVALDREVIRKGLAARYGQHKENAASHNFINPDEYIEKTISVSYDLPRLSSADVEELIREFELPINIEDRHKKLIMAGLGANPRRVKRFMNTLSVQLRLAEVAKVLNQIISDSQPRNFDLFLKLHLIAYRYPGVIAFATEDPGLLKRLQAISNEYRKRVGDRDKFPSEARKWREEALSRELSTISNLHGEEEFWQLMAEEPSFIDIYEVLPLTQLINWFRSK